MNKKQNINWIKSWLQKFGNRDNETFSTNVKLGETMWEISLQYDYDFEGDRIEPYNWCRKSSKHLNNNSLEDRTLEELFIIVQQLRLRKQFH